MVGGLIVLAVVLAAASAAGWGMRSRHGRFRPQAQTLELSRTIPAGSGRGGDHAPGLLTAADLGAPLGERATLVQFSTEFCAYCGPTRDLLGEVARSREGVALVEIDAGRRRDLARRLNVLSTPTVFVLAPDGSIAQRASGQQHRSAVLAAVSSVLDAAPAGVESDSGAAGE